jgi:hypothetical protein
MHRVLRVGGHAVWRSAAKYPWYRQRFELAGFKVDPIDIRENNQAIDRVNMYASCEYQCAVSADSSLARREDGLSRSPKAPYPLYPTEPTCSSRDRDAYQSIPQRTFIPAAAISTCLNRTGLHISTSGTISSRLGNSAGAYRLNPLPGSTTRSRHASVNPTRWQDMVSHPLLRTVHLPISLLSSAIRSRDHPLHRR